MDKSAIEAEISAQSKLMESNPINKALVSDIDRHIKNLEFYLNQQLIHIPAKVIVQNFLPEIDDHATLPAVISEEIWDSLPIENKRFAQRMVYEEISFDRHTKGFGFLYTIGEVTYDLGVVRSSEVDWYAKIREDKRETYKLTGAPVEIKLRAFEHLGNLQAQINNQAHRMVENYRAELTRDAHQRFSGTEVLGGWNRFFNVRP